MRDVAKWFEEIDRSKRHEKNWRTDSRNIIKRYRREQTETEQLPNRAKFDILWSNTETLKPALYSSTPKPNVDCRFHDNDQIAQSVAKILERALDFSIDTYDFDSHANRCVLDYLLPGRAVMRVRYIPTFEPTRVNLQQIETEKGTRFITEGSELELIEDDDVKNDEMGPYTMQDRLKYEEARCEYVNWEDFYMEPVRMWEECTWISFRHLMTQDELVEQFGEDGKKVPLQYSPLKESDVSVSTEENHMKYGEVYEIWDRTDEKVIVIARGFNDKPLLERDDPLELTGFFPIPQPIYAVKTNGTTIPRPEFMLYKDQADELDDLTGRISRIIQAIKANGFYAGSEKTSLSQLQNSDDNDLIPVDDWAAFMDKGGLEGMIAWMPIDERANVLKTLYDKRQDCIQSIYDITGISDIQRGATDARETKGAQELKAQFGTRRLFPRQQDVEHFFRDIFRLKAEIIAKHFSPQTLQLMTGVQITPQIVQVMQSDTLRSFKVDVQTDSILSPNDTQEKQDVSQFFQSIGMFMQAAGPLAQEGIIPPAAFKALILAGAARFRFAREVEDELNAPPPPPQPPPPDPSLQIAQIKAQADIEVAKINNTAKLQIHADTHDGKMKVAAAQTLNDQQKSALQFIVDLVSAQLKAGADAQSTAADVHAAQLDFVSTLNANQNQVQ